MKTDLDFWRDSGRRGYTEPFRALRRIERDMDRLMSRFFEGFSEGGASASPSGESFDFMPACDVQETENHFLLCFDVPGVNREDLKVDVVNNELVVSGERRREQKDESGGHFRSEREYGRFQRSFTLPSNIDPEELQADYRDGVLRIAVPKAGESQRRSIQVGEGKSGWWENLLGSGKQKKEKKEQAA